MNDFDDDLTAALRRELAGTAVPYDDNRAEEMIASATAHEPLGIRSWQAPLAAAAAVVVIGGGVAAFAATRGGPDPQAAGGGCPGSSTGVTVEPTPTVSPSSGDTAVILPAPGSAVPSSPTTTGSWSSVYISPLLATSTPAPSGPDSTGPTSAGPSETSSSGEVPSSSAAPSPVPTLDSASPCAPASAPAVSDTASETASPSAVRTASPSKLPSAPDTTAASTPATSQIVAPSPTSTATVTPINFELTAKPGQRVATPSPAVPGLYTLTVTSAHFESIAGDAGTIEVQSGTTTVLAEKVGSFVEVTDTPEHPLVFTQSAPDRVVLDCSGSSTDCQVTVSLNGSYRLG